MKGKLQTIFGLALVLLIFAGLYALIKASFHWFSGFDQSTRTAIIGAIAVLSVPLVTYFTNQSIERKRAVEQTMRLEKVRLYESFASFFMGLMLNNNNKSSPTQEQTVEFLCEITPKFITHASNDVIKKWGRFSRLLRDESDAIQKEPARFVLEFEIVLKALRKDLGHGSFNMAQGDIARLFINDIDNYLPSNKKKNQAANS